MTDLPQNPFLTARKPLIVDDVCVSVPVSQEVSDAINDVAAQTEDALVAALAPFGLHPLDIAAPEFRRIVYRDELDKDEA